MDLTKVVRGALGLKPLHPPNSPKKVKWPKNTHQPSEAGELIYKAVYEVSPSYHYEPGFLHVLPHRVYFVRCPASDSPTLAVRVALGLVAKFNSYYQCSTT